MLCNHRVRFPPYSRRGFRYRWAMMTETVKCVERLQAVVDKLHAEGAEPVLIYASQTVGLLICGGTTGCS